MPPPLRRRRQQRVPGLYRATVVNATDPRQAHRLQVTIPLVSGTTATWAPTLRDLGGPPQVGDEVLVGFEAGDPRHPYVIGVLATSAQPPVEMSDENGNSVRLSSSGIDLTTSGEVRVAASKIHFSAGLGETDAGMWRFSGVVKSDTLIANSVVAASYTPGAGNVM